MTIDEKFISYIETPLGTMTAISSQKALYFLRFGDHTPLFSNHSVHNTFISEQLQQELDNYFLKKQTHFKTPISLSGSAFQNKIWHSLKTIPPGETRAYEEIAKMSDAPNAARAVGNAINKNPFSILIPCHRVIRKNKQIGGYNSGTSLKEALLEHEGTLITAQTEQIKHTTKK
jgi:O-6-methylguanine DNA methyltransferase